MKLVKVLWYGMFISYHLRKRNTIDTKYITVSRFHYEMAQHYYKKAYGVDFISTDKR